MPRPARPPAVHVRVTLSLDPETDADLIEFYATLPPRQRAARTKARLRAGSTAAPQVEGVDDPVVDGLLSLLE